MDDSWSCDTLPEEMRAIIDAHYAILTGAKNVILEGESEIFNSHDIVVVPGFQSCLFLVAVVDYGQAIIYHLGMSYLNSSVVPNLTIQDTSEFWNYFENNDIKNLRIYYNQSFHASSDPNAEHPQSLELKLKYIHEQLSRHNINVEQIKIIPVDNGAFSKNSSVTFVIADGHISAWRVGNGGVKRVYIGRV